MTILLAVIGSRNRKKRPRAAGYMYGDSPADFAEAIRWIDLKRKEWDLRDESRSFVWIGHLLDWESTAFNHPWFLDIESIDRDLLEVDWMQDPIGDYLKEVEPEIEALFEEMGRLVSPGAD